MNQLNRLMTLLTLAAGVSSAQYVMVDLNASSNAVESANSISNGVQAGYASIPNTPSAGTFHAFTWSGTAATATDIHPSGWYSSQAWAAAGGQVAGYGLPTAGADVTAGAHALLWFGAGTFADLHPAGYGYSAALCTTGSVQGGYGLAPKTAKGGKSVAVQHGLLWFGSAASHVDLNPANMLDSRVYGCDGTRQVGDGSPGQTGTTHALLWSGSAATAVDLNPKNFVLSTAIGIFGDQQVGSGIGQTSPRHALLWKNTAASAIDLHPAGFQVSTAFATNGIQQAGDALDVNSHWHAMVWSGTAASAVDLNAFLPGGYSDAHARGIDALGNIAGFASTFSGTHAVIWVRVQ